MTPYQTIPTTTPRADIDRPHAWVWHIIGLVSVLAWATDLPLDDPQARSGVWGMATIALGSLIAFAGTRRFDLFSPLFFLGMSFAVLYGLAGILAFWAREESIFSSQLLDVLDYIPAATISAYISLVSLFFGYTVLWPLARLRGSQLLTARATDGQLYSLWLLCFSGGVAGFIVAIASDAYYHASTEYQSPLFYSGLGYLREAMFIAVPLAVAQALISKSRRWRIAGFLSAILFLAFAVPSGSKTLAILAVIFPLMAANYAWRRITRRQGMGLLLAGILVVLLYFPMNQLQRDFSLASEATVGSATVTDVGVVLDHIGQLTPGEFIDYAQDYLTLRLSSVGVVANILKRQAQGADLAWGETYARILYAFIPRLLWSEKPAVSISNQLTVTLGYGDTDMLWLGEAASTSAVGITLVGEFLYNYAVWIAPLFFSTLALFFRWLYETFRLAYRTTPALAIGLYASWWNDVIVDGAQTNLAAVVAGTIKMTILVLAALWLLRGHSITQAHTDSSEERPA
jgi:hypothetical protein